MKRLYAFIAMWLMIGSTFAQVLVNETFENGNTVGQAPSGWICDDNGWKAGITIPDDNEARGRKPHTGDWYMYATYNMDVWAYKEINVTAGTYYRVSFWYSTWHVDHFNLEVKAGANANPSAMSVSVVPQFIVDNEEFEQTSGVFQAPSSGTFYVGFHSVADNGPWYLSVDDIIIEQTEQYNFAVEQLTPDTTTYFGEEAYLRFALTNTGDESETVNFNTLNSSDLDAVFFVNGSQVSQISLSVGETAEVVAIAALPMNLSDGQELHVRLELASTHTSHIETADFKVTALAPFSDFPLEEGFENEFVPAGWQNRALNGNYAFDRVEDCSTPDATPHDGSQYMARFFTYTNPADNNAELVSPKMELSSTGNIVRFWIYRNGNHNINRPDLINVYYNTEPHADGGQLLGTVNRATFLEPVIDDVDDWYEYSFTFDAPTGYGFVVFEGVSGYGWNLLIDDVFVSNSAEDHDAPTVISVTGNQTYADTEMNFNLRVRDASGVPATFDATYTIWGVDYPITLTRGAKQGRGNYDFSATLPAFDNHTHGTMVVRLVDDLGNASDSDPIDIRWDYQRPLLYEPFEECDILSIPEGWSQQGNETMWQWWVLGPTYYVDYDENEFYVEPHSGSKQAVLEWDDYNNDPQDQTLVTPTLTINRPTTLTFWTWVQYGSLYYDHFAVRVLDCSEGTWEDKWDATDLPYGQINKYDEPISINLDEYQGKNIKIGFRGYNDFGEFLAWDWFIDDVKVVPTDTTDVNVNELPDLKFSVFPNPTTGKIHIESEKRIEMLQLMSVNGLAIETKRPDCLSFDMDLSAYSKGLYLLRIVTADGVMTKKITLE